MELAKYFVKALKNWALCFQHDTTVAALLSALQLFDGKSPEYTATVLAELHETSKDNFVVRLFYKNETNGDTAHQLQLPSKNDASLVIPSQNECFRGYTGISLSVCPSVYKICQSDGGGIKSHSVTALVTNSNHM